MSGFALLWDRRHGAMADAADIEPMLAAMRHRGRDGMTHRLEGAAALGVCWTDSTGDNAPPLCSAPDAGVGFSGACRIDNRSDLVAALDLRDDAVSDARIVLESYLRWGRSCAARLEGDFAFAIWDARKQAVFAARDHFGVKPLYYRCDRDHLALASELGAIRAVGRQRLRLRAAKVSAFLAGICDEPEETALSDIRRLPARHSLWAEAGTVEVTPYWSFEPVNRPAERDFVEGFRHRFDKAVEVRLRGGRTGAMLSGGLDSSSICATASRLAHAGSGTGFDTYSVLFDAGSRFDERQWIDAVNRSGNHRPHQIHSLVAPLKDIDRVVSEQEGHFLAPGLPLVRAVFQTASADGMRAILDGHGGDEVVSHGYARLNELARDGHWLRLWREARGAADIYGNSAGRLLLYLAARRALAGRFAPVARAGLRLKRRLRPGDRTAGDDGRGIIRAELFQRTHVADRARLTLMPPAGAVDDETLRHQWQLSATMVSDSFEVLDKAAAHNGIEPRYPFWDKQLVEYCLSLPSEMKLANGWTRFVLRKAMEDRLPAAVCWRRDKVDFKSNLSLGLVTHHDKMISDLFDRKSGRISAFVDIDRARASYARVKSDPVNVQLRDIENVWRSVVLDRWLVQLESHGIAIA